MLLILKCTFRVEKVFSCVERTVYWVFKRDLPVLFRRTQVKGKSLPAVALSAKAGRTRLWQVEEEI